MSHFEEITLPHPMDKEAIQKLEDQFRQELLMLDNLLHQLVDVIGLDLKTLTAKSSLAFLIENKKVEYPETWKTNISDFKKQISNANEENGKPGVTWTVSEAINEAYLKFLDDKISNTEDEGLKRKLSLMKKLVEQTEEFNRQAKTDGKPISFGGVSTDYVPKWYYLLKKTNE